MAVEALGNPVFWIDDRKIEPVIVKAVEKLVQTKRRLAELAAAESRRLAELSAERATQVLENTSDCVCAFDEQWRLTYANQRTREYMRGCDPVGKHLLDIFPGIESSVFHDCLLAATSGREPASVEGYLRSADAWYEATIVPDQAGVTAFFRDISARKKSEGRVWWLANHDSLTHLPNRILLHERLEELTDNSEADASFSLLLVDVDEFKRVNDTLGHDAGDRLLQQFAERLSEATRRDDLVARMGGDEFAIILNGLSSEQDVEASVNRIYHELRRPFVYEGRIFDCNASIGASTYPNHGDNRHDLMKHADIALFAAKAAGRANVKIFRPEMKVEMQIRLSMLERARKALKENRIGPFYQAKVDLHSGGIVGFEALLRWQDDTLRTQPPHTIAAAFEDPTLAAEISDRMIERVLADMVAWRAAGVDFGHVAINAAAAEFRRGDFAEQLLQRLAAASLSPSLLQLEVTETVFLGRGAGCVEHALQTLDKAGVKIAMDDFGTGYASLSHLKQFPLTALKIDRSFVRELDGHEATAIVDAVVNLGKSLKIQVIAEGIESAEQEAALTAMGCGYGQGYLYSRAISAAAVPDLVAGWPDRMGRAAA